jgi:hypothetical protein
MSNARERWRERGRGRGVEWGAKSKVTTRKTIVQTARKLTCR